MTPRVGRDPQDWEIILDSNETEKGAKTYFGWVMTPLLGRDLLDWETTTYDLNKTEKWAERHFWWVTTPPLGHDPTGGLRPHSRK